MLFCNAQDVLHQPASSQHAYSGLAAWPRYIFWHIWIYSCTSTIQGLSRSHSLRTPHRCPLYLRPILVYMSYSIPVPDEAAALPYSCPRCAWWSAGFLSNYPLLRSSIYRVPCNSYLVFKGALGELVICESCRAIFAKIRKKWAIR